MSFMYALLSLVLLRYVTSTSTSTSELPVCVIGGGISGAYFTYSLQQHICSPHHDQQQHVMLFEAADRLGGRLYSKHIAGHRVEIGGSIVVQANKYFIQAAKSLNLTLVPGVEGRLGVFDGNKLAFKTSDYKIVSIAKVLWRYGLAFKHIEPFLNDLIKKFESFYDLQDNGKFFTTAEDFWNASNLFPLTQEVFEKSLKKLLNEKQLPFGIETSRLDAFVNEIVSGVTKVNYNQQVSLNSLAGSIAMVGTIFEARYAQDGNDQVVEKLIRSSPNTQVHLQTRVSRIVENGDEIQLELGDQSRVECKQVIIAAPLEHADLEIVVDGKELSSKLKTRRFQQVWATFVQGKFNPRYFREDSESSVPEFILTSRSSNSPFNSIGKRRAMSDGTSVVKFFSHHQLNSSLFDEIFLPGSKVHYAHRWDAYPVFAPPERFPPMIISPHIYYINSVENGASCIEIMAVAAKNVALMSCNSLTGEPESSQSPQQSDFKDEL